MIIRIGLENGIEGRSQAWALDFPGCFAYGEDGPTALLQVPEALLRHEAWMAGHTSQSWVTLGDFDIRLVETWQVYYINEAYEEACDGYEVNAWFRDDWRPLAGLEIQHGLDMLSWSRADLLQCASDLIRRNPGPAVPWRALEHSRHPPPCRGRRMVVPRPPGPDWPARMTFQRRHSPGWK